VTRRERPVRPSARRELSRVMLRSAQQRAARHPTRPEAARRPPARALGLSGRLGLSWWVFHQAPAEAVRQVDRWDRLDPSL